MLVVGPMCLAISATAPFNDQMILSWNIGLWVVILDALDLVVPLLKRHLGLLLCKAVLGLYYFFSLYLVV